MPLLLLAGCSTGSEVPAAKPSETRTPLTAYDTSAVALARGPFCSRIPATGVVGALDGTAADAATWDNGEPAALTSRLRDVAHEYGCRYTREGAEAAAWVFAPPVTPRKAAALVRQARSAEGCRPAADPPAFGRPSVAVLCTEGGGTTASYRGLFGDAWLTCTLRRAGLTEARLVEQTGAWCVQVVEAARVR